MLKKVEKTIERFKMLNKGDRVIAAVSGGVDSSVLLDVLLSLSDKYGLEIIAAHLNHGMRGEESKRDFDFVKGIARGKGLKFIGKTINLPEIINKEKGSVQALARRFRYKFLEEAAKRHRADKIATGHTLDDNAETVLMRIIQGTSLRGLRGIPFIRGKFIRPLMEVERKALQIYARQKGIGFVEDSSNKTKKYLRNKLRLQLIPVLKRYNPNIKQELARLAVSAGSTEDYLEKEADKAYKGLKVESESEKLRIVFNLNKVKKLPDAIKTKIFLKAVEELKKDTLNIYSYHLDDILELIDSKSPQCLINLPDNIIVRREYDKLIFTREKGLANSKRQWAVRRQGTIGKQQGRGYERVLNINGNTNIKEVGRRFNTTIIEPSVLSPFSFANIGIKPLTDNTAYFDYDNLAAPLIARNFRAGDRFKPFGMEGTKKVKDLFIEKKIPKDKRTRIPVILSGKDIIWIAGVRRGNTARIEKDTKRILVIEMV